MYSERFAFYPSPNCLWFRGFTVWYIISSSSMGKQIWKTKGQVVNFDEFSKQEAYFGSKLAELLGTTFTNQRLAKKLHSQMSWYEAHAKIKITKWKYRNKGSLFNHFHELFKNAPDTVKDVKMILSHVWWKYGLIETSAIFGRSLNFSICSRRSSSYKELRLPR